MDDLGPRLDKPPPRSATAALPDDFGRRFLIFVDTEEEFDWSQTRRRDATAITALAALPEAHARFRDHGAKPCYLIDFPVANDPRGAARLEPLVRAGEGTIGAQLHPWVTPPNDEELNDRNSFVGNLPIDLERSKIKMLTARIRQAIGRDPLVYRAGRYGVGPNSGALLEGLGYRLDVSVRAGFDYGREGGPDFTHHPVSPWWSGPKGGLLELPLTTAFIGALGDRGRRLHAAAGALPPARGLLARVGLVNRVALTPEGTPIQEAREAVRRLLGSGVQLFSLSFHSPSLVPGHTPYVRDRADLAMFWAWWDGILDLFARAGVMPATTDELIAAAWAARA